MAFNAAGETNSNSPRPVIPDLNSTPEGFTLGAESNISTTNTSGAASSQDSTITSRKRGFGTMIAENQAQHEARRIWKGKNVFSQNNIPPQTQIPRSNQLARPVILYVSSLFPFPQFGNPSVSSNNRVLPISPCLLASRNLRLTMSRGVFGYSPSRALPVAVCSKHGNLGFLKLDNIENNHHQRYYTLMIHHQPNLVHVYDQCLLNFPPAQPKYTFHEIKHKFMGNCYRCLKPLEMKEVVRKYRSKSFCSDKCREVVAEFDKRMELVKEAKRNTTKVAGELDKVIASFHRYADQKKGAVEDAQSSSTTKRMSP